MPKKINTFWSRNKTEQQIITARLIEISLKVDDYIYKHKLISVCEAEQYMREVSSYKTQCRDERSLQVIEKLTRCMKAIIFDDQELRPNIHSVNIGSSIEDGDDRVDSISPVYSIPDEDRAQLTQIAEEGAINATVANKDIEIADLSIIDDNNDLIHNDSITATADYAGSKIPINVDIHRDMSSLSLKAVEAPFNITSSDVNCSQSILNNFEGFVSEEAVAVGLVCNFPDKGKTRNEMQAGGNTDLGNIPNNKTTFTIEPNKTKRTSIAPKKVIIRDTESSLISKKKEPTSVINTANYNLTITSNQKDNITASQSPFYPATNNIPESEIQIWYDSNRTCPTNDSSHTMKDANYSSQSTQIYKAVNPIIVNHAANFAVNIPTNTAENSRALTAIAQDDSTTIKKKRGPRKKKTLDEKEIKLKNKRLNRPPKRNKEKPFTNSAKNKRIPIYNENIVNDLSWIENIRYVREIKVDENDPKLNLEDSFWDNYYLPANWSENEFL